MRFINHHDMKPFIVLVSILLLSSCGGNQQQVNDVTTDTVSQYIVSDSLREEREMMLQCIDFCEETCDTIIYKHRFRAVLRAILRNRYRDDPKRPSVQSILTRMINGDWMFYQRIQKTFCSAGITDGICEFILPLFVSREGKGNRLSLNLGSITNRVGRGPNDHRRRG